MESPSLIALNVGNTRTQIGSFVSGQLGPCEHFPKQEVAPTAQQVVQWWLGIADHPRAAILLASVNDAVADPLAAMIEDQLSVGIYRIGKDVPVPIGRKLDPETLTGIDRLLNAAAAYDHLQEACIIIDAGSAVTIDFVDGEGTYHGGAIAPGATMQLQALHEHAAGLPELPFARPDAHPFGRSTSQAMLQGVFHGIRGMVQRLVEQYAEYYTAFPRVIATGGDAQLLFETEGLIDNIVPELTLLGIQVTARHALAMREVDDSDVRS